MHSLTTSLAAIPFFAGLEPSLLEEFATSALRREYGAGETIFLEGEPSPGLFILESGYVKVVKGSIHGREQSLEFIGPSQPFNTVSIFTNRPSPASAITLETTTAWMLPRASMISLLRRDPLFAERIIENMADRLVSLVDLVADLSLRSVIGRLAKLVLAQAVDDAVRRPRWFTLPELAARLGTVPDVVQRALGRLAAEGLVEVTRREIRIKDRPALEELAS